MAIAHVAEGVLFLNGQEILYDAALHDVTVRYKGKVVMSGRFRVEPTRIGDRNLVVEFQLVEPESNIRTALVDLDAELDHLNAMVDRMPIGEPIEAYGHFVRSARAARRALKAIPRERRGIHLVREFGADTYSSQIDKATVNGRDVTVRCKYIKMYALSPRPRWGIGWATLYTETQPRLDGVIQAPEIEWKFGLIGLTWNGVGSEG